MDPRTEERKHADPLPELEEPSPSRIREIQAGEPGGREKAPDLSGSQGLLPFFPRTGRYVAGGGEGERSGSGDGVGD